MFRETSHDRPKNSWVIFGGSGLKNLEKILRYYQTVLPIIIGVDDFCQSKTVTKNTFNLEDLRMDTPWVRLIAFERLGMQDFALSECKLLSEKTLTSMNGVISLAEHSALAKCKLGDYNGAATDFGMLAEVCIEQKQFSKCNNVIGKLSVVIEESGNAEKGEIWRERALYSMEENERRIDRLCLIADRGCALYRKGKYDEAISNFETVIACSGARRRHALQKRAMQINIYKIYHNIALCYLRKKQEGDAIRLYNQSIEYIKRVWGSTNNIHAAFCSLNLSVAFSEAKNTGAALKAAYEGLFLKMLTCLFFSFFYFKGAAFFYLTFGPGHRSTEGIRALWKDLKEVL